MSSTTQSSTLQTFRSRLAGISPLWMIVLIWVASNLLLLALQGLKLGVGLHVHPLGEDRVWIRLLTNYPAFEMDKQWWSISSRNPLAPLWYQAFSPLILGLPDGIYVLRKLVDLFLAISVYLLVDQISRTKLQKFAFACGVLVLFWNFSGYLEQIMLVMLISLGLSILSVYFYCRYLDSARATAEYFAVSLLCFFTALATYSIQCGVPIAVFVIGLFRRSEMGGGWRFSSAAFGAIKDTCFFAALFVLFTQIWITTSGPTSEFFQLYPELFLKQFLTSVANLVWHFDTSDLIGSLNRHWPLWLVATSASIFAILFYFLFVVYMRKQAIPPIAGLSILSLVLVLAVFLALVAPTVLLESTSTTWFPGSRSRMVQQCFQPVLYLSILFLLTRVLIRRTGRTIEYARNAGIACLCALAVVVGLEYNRKLSEQASFERKLAAGLKRIVPTLEKPTHFIVKMKGVKLGEWYSGVSVAIPSLFVETAYMNFNKVWLDPVYEGVQRTPKPVIFGSDQQGVYCPESGDWVPYQDVVLVEFNGHKVTRLTTVDPKTFSGYGVIYRETPLATEFK